MAALSETNSRNCVGGTFVWARGVLTWNDGAADDLAPARLPCCIGRPVCWQANRRSLGADPGSTHALIRLEPTPGADMYTLESTLARLKKRTASSRRTSGALPRRPTDVGSPPPHPPPTWSSSATSHRIGTRHRHDRAAAFDAISRGPTHGGCECEVAQSYDDCPETACGACELGAGPQLPAAGAAGVRAYAAASAVGLWTVRQARASRGHNSGTAARGVPSVAARAVRVSLWAGRLAAPMVGLRHPLAKWR